MQNYLDHVAGPRFILIGEDESLSLYTLKYVANIIKANIAEKVFIVNPEKDNLSYLPELFDSNKIITPSVNNRIEEIINLGPLIVIGISLFSPEFDIVKKSQYKNLVFIESLGMFKETLTKQFKNLTFIESTFTDYIKSGIVNDAEYQKIILTESSNIFINRESEKRRIIDFGVSPILRALKLIGMPGIGKRSLLNDLRTKGLIEGAFVEFTFQDEFDSLTDVLSLLFLKFKIDYKIDDEFVYSLKEPGTKKLIKLFFKAFDDQVNLHLIFYNLHFIYNPTRRFFFDTDLADFFTQLLTRQTYNGNKVYFISNSNFKLNVDADHLIGEETVQKLNIQHLKTLLEKEFLRIGAKEMADSVSGVEDDELDAVCDGHPYIAKLLVQASQTYGFLNLVRDKDLSLLFQREHKVKYLLSKIAIDEFERSLLIILALFTEEVDIQFIKIATKNLELIESLLNKFLLEKTVYDDASIRYYVPALIKETILSEVNNQTLADRHNLIGDYYWKQTEELSTDFIEGYRKSYYHFNAAGNNEKTSLLTLRFKDKMIRQSESYIRVGQLKKGWELLNELYIKGYLKTITHLMKYLSLELRLAKKLSELGNKIETALKEFNNHPSLLFIKIKYLFFINEIDQAQNLCEKIGCTEFPTDRKDLNMLYLRILYKKISKEEAVAKNKAWINQLEKSEKHTQNKGILANAYELLLDYEISKLPDFKTIIRYSLRSIESITELHFELIPILEMETEFTDQIIAEFEQIPFTELGSLRSFIGYLKRKKRYKKITDLRNQIGVELSHLDIPLDSLFSLAKEQAKRTEDLIFYSRNKMGQVEGPLADSFEKLGAYLDPFREMIEGFSKWCIFIASLGKRRSTFHMNYITVLAFRENLMNVDKFIIFSKNPTARQAFISSFKQNYLFVEGETDEIYLRAAARALGKNHLNINIKWIGHLDVSGNANFSGDTALNHTYNYYRANQSVLSRNGSVILLYDSDTMKPPSDFGNLYVRVMHYNSDNLVYKIGIENLLSLTDDFAYNDFYQESKKIDEYGAETIIKKLNKKSLCEFVCNKSEMKNRSKIFKIFAPIFESIESLIG